MRAPSATELLGLWERGLGQSPGQRALALLTLACGETPTEQLAQLSAGQRDEHLLTLRESTFGTQFSGLANCPACGERLEINFTASDIRVSPGAQPPEQFTLELAGCAVHFRLPNSLDLANLTTDAELAANRQRLLERCVLSSKCGQQEILPSELPEEVVCAMAQIMDRADPQAVMQLVMTCPQCRHDWRAALDFASFFWSEIHAWAVRLLREVHMLASAYGWREADILALSPWRRQAYLEMLH